MCRIAVAEGIAPEDALLMATLHPARGARAAGPRRDRPGLRADLVLLDDLDGLPPARVCKDGAARRRRRPRRAVRARRRSRSACARRCAPRRWSPTRSRSGRGRPRARDRDRPGQLITLAREEEPTAARRPRRRRPGARPRQDRRRRAPPRDRPRRQGARARLRPATGAFASTVAHDAHNLVVVGVDDADMPPAPTGCRRSAAGSPSPATAPCAASSRCRSPACSPTSRSRTSSPRLEALQVMLREQGVGDARRS